MKPEYLNLQEAEKLTGIKRDTLEKFMCASKNLDNKVITKHQFSGNTDQNWIEYSIEKEFLMSKAQDLLFIDKVDEGKRKDKERINENKRVKKEIARGEFLKLIRPILKTMFYGVWFIPFIEITDRIFSENKGWRYFSFFSVLVMVSYAIRTSEKIDSAGSSMNEVKLEIEKMTENIESIQSDLEEIREDVDQK